MTGWRTEVAPGGPPGCGCRPPRCARAALGDDRFGAPRGDGGRGAGQPLVYGPARLDRRAVVQYRAWRASAASIAVGRHTGFAHECDGPVIPLGDEPAR